MFLIKNIRNTNKLNENIRKVDFFEFCFGERSNNRLILRFNFDFR